MPQLGEHGAKKLLTELERDIVKDCENMRSFLHAAQVSEYVPYEIRSLTTRRP